MSVIDTLITDRTAQDVDELYTLLSQGQNPSAGHKGAYNASDLNRVGEAVNYLKEKLCEIGIQSDPSEFEEIYDYQEYSGPLVTFESNIQAPVIKLTASINPVQSGSGTPSPTNVRPISGWTGCNLSVSGEDASNPTVYSVSWQTEAGAVYGGTLNVLTGVLTVTHGYIAFDGVTSGKKFTNAGANNTYYISLPQASSMGLAPSRWVPVATLISSGVICSNMPIQDIDRGTAVPRFAAYIGGSGDFQPRVKFDSSISSLTQANQKLKDWSDVNKPFSFVYLLASPVTYQLTPQAVTTMVGTNYILSDTGDVFVKAIVRYCVKLKEYAKMKVDWAVTDIPVISQMQKYLDAVWMLWVAVMFYRPDTELPEEMRFFNYMDANQIEELLRQVNLVATRIELSHRQYSGRHISGVNCLP